MKALHVTITYTNGDIRKVILDSSNQLKMLKEDKRVIKSIKGVTIKL